MATPPTGRTPQTQDAETSVGAIGDAQCERHRGRESFPRLQPTPSSLASYDVSIYDTPVIKTFADKDTEALFNGTRVRRFVNIEKTARRKLEYLDAATMLEDLRVPPGNRLEALKGERSGQHSIRVNDQFRVCFRWTRGDACDVEICDYH